jgi:molybdopterin-containing oxidoreductase family iron-sulfur binding subunit
LGKEVTEKVGGKVLPYFNPDPDLGLCESIRRKNVVEKCIFCDHRVKNGKKPYCVDSCPAEARIFGDAGDPNSEVSKLLKNNKAARLQESQGTQLNVYYINEFDTNKFLAKVTRTFLHEEMERLAAG